MLLLLRQSAPFCLRLPRYPVLKVVVYCVMGGHISPTEEGILDHDVGTRPWADLPPELLSLIADRLGLVELLGFRGVCRGWRYAASTASAQSESAKELKPSFLVHGADEKCNFYYQGSEKTYSINIPELDKAICLASDHGWLLLARHDQEQAASLFFFCPFSRTRIELPAFPRSELSDHLASFSAPPTSPNCTVAVAYLSNNSKIELHQLHRGASSWTNQEFKLPKMGTLTCAYYHYTNRCFYFMDDDKTVLKFSTEEQQLKSYVLVPGNTPGINTLPFASRKHTFKCSNMTNRMGLQDDISISICGTYFLTANNLGVIIKNEKMEPPSPESPDGSAIVPQLKGIWIHPRFHQIPPNQSW